MKVFNKLSIGILVVVLMLGLGALIVKAATFVNLGTATSFSVLADAAITNVPTSAISGDVGLSPAAGSNYSGLTDAEVGGVIYAVDGTGPAGSVNNPALLTAAKNDLVTAYNNAAGQTPDLLITADLGGQTLGPGTYRDDGSPASLSLNGTLILDGEGDANAIFVFQSASTLVTGSGSTVSLINGAQACNVFWQVGSSTTFGTGSTFAGTVMALAAITDDGGSTINGRILARNAAVTLNNTTINTSICAASGDGGLGATSGITPETLSIPWNVVIVGLAAMSTGTLLFSLRKRGKKND